MALSVAEQTIITAFDNATSVIAARIQNLINAGTVDNPDFIAALQTEVNNLNQMGSGGTTPAPSGTTPAP